MTRKISPLASCLIGFFLCPPLFAASYEDFRHAGQESFAQGNYKQAETNMLAAVQEAEAFGPRDIRLAQSLKTLADFYKLRSQVDKATPIYERALRTQEAALGCDSSEVLASVVSLIHFRIAQNDLPKADRLTGKLIGFAGKKVSDAPKALTAPDPKTKSATLTKYVDLASALDSVGTTYRLRGNQTLAEPLLKYSLALREKTLTPGHLALARAYGNLGSLYLSQHKNQEAEYLFKKAIETSKKTLGGNNPQLFSKMDDLGHCYLQIGKYSEGEQLYRDILKRGWMPASCYMSLGQIYTRAGQLSAAEKAFQTSIQLTQKSNGKETCLISPILEEYSVLLKRMQRHTEAEQLLARSKSLKSL